MSVLRLDEWQIYVAEQMARDKGLPFLLDHLGLDGLANDVTELIRMLGQARDQIEGKATTNRSDQIWRLQLLKNLDAAIAANTAPAEDGGSNRKGTDQSVTSP